MILTKGFLSKIAIILFFLGQVNFVVAQNNVPVAYDNVDTVDFNTTLIVNDVEGLLSDDMDVDGDNLTVTEFTVDGLTGTFNAGDSAVIPGVGTITINADGSYVFVPVAGYDGPVPPITYTIFDGTDTATALLLLVVETNDDLLEIDSIFSCNQGYTLNGDYKIRYRIRLKNKSLALEAHTGSLVTQINLQNDLVSVFGNISTSCITVENPIGPPTPLATIVTGSQFDYFGNFYDQDWFINIVDGENPLNSDFEDLTSTTIFNSNAIANNVLYPGQSITLEYCVTVDEGCIASNPIDFDNIFNVTSQSGNGVNGSDSLNLVITDFHTSETTVAAKLFVPNIAAGNIFSEPPPEPDGTYDFTNTVIIKNDGATIAKDVNFNMGLGDPNVTGISFNTITITSNPVGVSVNPSYDGNNNTLLLNNGVNLNPGEEIILTINYITNLLGTSNTGIDFLQLDTSMTQGTADTQGPAPTSGSGIDEFLPENRKLYSYVFWSDNVGTGRHLDRYYVADNNTDTPSSNDQCLCDEVGMRFLNPIELEIEKEIISIVPAPSGIPQHKEIAFRLTIINKSLYLRVNNLQIQDDLEAICGGSIVSFTPPTIDLITSTATINPTINNNYNGASDINIFDGISGLLNPPPNPNAANPTFEQIVVDFKVVLSDLNCSGADVKNTATFTATNPLGIAETATGDVTLHIFLDTDGDGIADSIDIDDDNDGIPDLLEYAGLPISDPLADSDFDLIPNYNDVDYGFDLNGDGIVDAFDFDLDGIPNHFDLDSDNDGITDITETGHISLDTNLDGMTNNGVGINGLDDTLETTVDSGVINYIILDTDLTGKPNYLDIDSDGDGIVDNTEAQLTETDTTVFYIAPNPIADDKGLVYINILIPTDTDSDNIPDYMDTNSDDNSANLYGDFRDDIIEGWDTNNDGIPDTVISISDFDGDGLDDAFDLVPLQTNSSINSSNGSDDPSIFPNNDLPLTVQKDWREVMAPVLTIVDAQEFEGNDLKFAVYLDKVYPSDINIEFSVIDIETSSSDYVFDTPTIQYTIPKDTGLLAEGLSFDIFARLDKLNEMQIETFTLVADVVSLNVADPTPITLGSIIFNNIGGIEDIDPEPELIVSDPTVVEGKKLEFILKLVDPLDHDVSIGDYRPINFTTTTVAGTANQPQDYQPISATPITIAPTVTMNVVDVITIDDNLVEEAETMKLEIDITSDINNIFNTNPSLDATGTILDNDITNLFSPNGDGLSDDFEIISLLKFLDFKIQIFDRWGSEVYDYSNQGNPSPVWWDGTYNSSPAPEGVYYYTIDFNDGLTKPKSGFVQIIR